MKQTQDTAPNKILSEMKKEIKDAIKTGYIQPPPQEQAEGFTGGDWHVSHSPVTKSKLSGRFYKSVKNTKSIGGKIIVNAFGDTKEEAEANAALIAAAPDLLKALRNLVNCIPDDLEDYPDADFYHMVMDAQDQAKAALQKANPIKQ